MHVCTDRYMHGYTDSILTSCGEVCHCLIPITHYPLSSLDTRGVLQSLQGPQLVTWKGSQFTVLSDSVSSPKATVVPTQHFPPSEPLGVSLA